MILEFPTWSNHGYMNADSSQSWHHCCGCWHVKISGDNPLEPYVICNECGEMRPFLAPVGVDKLGDSPAVAAFIGANTA